MSKTNGFRFKQFFVAHHKCAMKVGFDAVMLGAWAAIPEKTANVLDIGTGSGVIALMLAQRTPETVNIYGIELDEEASGQAVENAAQSPWANRIKILQGDFNHFSAIKNTYSLPLQFEVIVSNPPFYENHLLPPGEKRNLARHAGRLSYVQLLKGVSELLAPEGLFSVILPHQQAQSFRQSAAGLYGLFCHRATSLRQAPGKPVIRQLLQFGWEKPEFTEELTLDTGGTHPSTFSDACKQLTKEFYLDL